MADGRGVVVDIRADDRIRAASAPFTMGKFAGCPTLDLPTIGMPQPYRSLIAGRVVEHEPPRSGLVEISISIEAKSPMSEQTRDR
jgi:hypothetical protein